ncbi:hypothetical protein CEXT_362641 [Caerostris extrusa]|uniref:Uncharacterized protein n=1 Tax=Caerostris extrusa TaxID=172846 RepID=A0AAV4XD34_CAEEX|nr:hypothetical protein CEXT_362641 [Caerostris extrusa]
MVRKPTTRFHCDFNVAVVLQRIRPWGLVTDQQNDATWFIAVLCKTEPHSRFLAVKMTSLSCAEFALGF